MLQTIQLHNVSSAPTAPQMYVEILGSDASALTISLTHPSAVLAVTFGSDSATAFSGGLDKRVRQYVHITLVRPAGCRRYSVLVADRQMGLDVGTM